MKQILFFTALSLLISCSYDKDELVVLPEEKVDAPVGGGGGSQVFPAITYTTHTKVYFDKYCISCHAPGATQNFFPLTSFSEVSVYSGASGAIESRVLNLGNMPPSGTSSGFLTAAEKDTLEAWINQGAPE